MDEHYICRGGCKGISSTPGACQTEGCPNHKHSLEKCTCSDNKHYGAFDNHPDSKNRNR